MRLEAENEALGARLKTLNDSVQAESFCPKEHVQAEENLPLGPNEARKPIHTREDACNEDGKQPIGNGRNGSLQIDSCVIPLR